MLHKLMYTVVIAAFVGGVALGQQERPQAPGAQAGAQKGLTDQPMWGKIVRVAGNAITFMPYDPATQKFGAVKTYQVAPEGLKVYRMKGKDQRENLAGGLKGTAFQTIPVEGLYSSLQTKDNRVTQIGLYDLAGFQAAVRAAGAKGGAGGAGGK
jgi:hypothetical protein